MTASFLAASGPAGAAELRLGAEPYRYTVIDQDLRTTLHEFGANLGLRVAISDAVQGRVRGRLPPLAPRDFLSRLAALYGFDWYFDGYLVSVTAQTESVSHIVPITGVQFRTLKGELDALGLTDERFVARPEGVNGDLMLLAGPPRYVQLVEEAVAQLIAAASRAVTKPAVVTASAPPPAKPALPAPSGPSLRVFRAGAEQQVTFDHP